MKKLLFSVALIAASFTSTAQVGVGTTVPSAALDIVSTGNDATTKALEINNSAATEMVTVLNDGKVGIGTDTPVGNLHVVGSDPSIVVGTDDASRGALVAYGGQAGNSNGGRLTLFSPIDFDDDVDSYIMDAYRGTLRLRRIGQSKDLILNKEGKLSLGAISPLADLHVSRESDTKTDFLLGVGNTARGLHIVKNHNGSMKDLDFYWSNHPTVRDGDLNFYSSQSSANVTFKSGGSVGIGTTTPAAKLEVTGAIKVADSVASPADGMIVYGDKGSGLGFYGRVSGAWVKLH